METCPFKVKKTFSTSQHYFGGKKIFQLKIHDLLSLYPLHISEI